MQFNSIPRVKTLKRISHLTSAPTCPALDYVFRHRRVTVSGKQRRCSSGERVWREDDCIYSTPFLSFTLNIHWGKKIALSIIAEVWLRHKLCDLHKQQLNASAQILRPLTLAVPTILNNQLVRWRDSWGNVACLAFLHKSNTSVRVANKPLLNGW